MISFEQMARDHERDVKITTRLFYIKDHEDPYFRLVEAATTGLEVKDLGQDWWPHLAGVLRRMAKRYPVVNPWHYPSVWKRTGQKP